MPEELKSSKETGEGGGPEISLDNILSVVEEPKAEEVALSTVDREVELAKEKEEQEKREKRLLEKATFFAKESGRLHYQQLANPAKYDEDRRHAQGGTVSYDYKPLEDLSEDSPDMKVRLYGGGGSFNGNDIREGRISVNFPQFMGLSQIDRVDGPSKYLKSLKDSILSKIVQNNRETDQLIDLRRSGGDIWGSTISLATQEERDAEVERLKKLKQQSRDQMILAVRKLAEGFGEAALEAGDLPVAIENLDFTGTLENKDTLIKIKEVVEKLKASADPKDRETLKKSVDLFKKIKERRERQEKMQKQDQGLI